MEEINKKNNNIQKKGWVMEILLTKDEMHKCIMFSEKCAENQQEIEFGQGDTNPRSEHEIARDNLIGKIAEVAFAASFR